MTNPLAYGRLFLAAWMVLFVWLFVFQVAKGGWMWALGNLLLAAFGGWMYVESVIEDLKKRDQ